MKRNFSKWMLVFIIILLIVSMLTPYLTSAAESDEPDLYSDSAFLYNVSTGEVLLDKNGDKEFSIHNLSMLMTTYLLIKDIENGDVKLKDKAEISNKSWNSPSPKMFLEVGNKVTVKKLLEGLTIASGNDAAITTAEFLSGNTDKFVKRMNKEAEKLGMKNTNFDSPNGNSNDTSTAKDLFILSKEIVTEYPEYLEYFTTKEMSYETRPGKPVNLKNQNNFIYDNPNSTGLKSGWGSGQYHLAAAVNKNGSKYIAITLNASNPSKRSSDIYRLLTYGYSQYDTIQIAKAGEKYTDFSVYKSTTPGPSTVLYKDNISAVVRKGVTIEQLEIDYEGHSYIVGGTNAGDEVGKVKVYLDDKLLTEGSIVSAESFEKVNGISSFLDSIALIFRQLLDFVSDSFH